MWLPSTDPSVAVRREQTMSRARRIAVGGEYVIHISGESQQVLFMKFLDNPETNTIGTELGVQGSGPELRGLTQEFEIQPAIFRDGGDAPNGKCKGSRFVVQGFMYNTILAETNHLGNVRIMLARDRSCSLRDFKFFDHVEPYICWREQS